MSRIESHQKIARRSLVGATTVEVGIDWIADANVDLSEIDNRRAKSITLGFRGGYEGMFEALFGMESKTGEGHLRLDFEHATIVRDLLSQALELADVRKVAPTPAESEHAR